ncbi:fungal pheromone STE3G-protein-coupled receptor, partial [Wilcoxina mikolae CBS 423.85]
LSIILCSVPAIWHWKHNNIPAIFLIIWVNWFTVSCFVDSFIWPDDHALLTGWEGGIYCDIQSKVAVGAFAGNLGAVAAIARNLANILSDNITVVRTKAVRRKELIKDLTLCLAVPILMMITHYFFQPSRYVLYAITGCQAMFDLSWLGIVFHLMWMPIQGVMAGYFAVLVIWRIHKHRRRFSDLLSNNSNITKSRFMRLFILSIILLVIEVPVTFYIFYLNLNAPILPYNWDRIHGEGWLYITKIPTNGQILFDRWIPVGTGFLIFIVFGLGKDAVVMYRDWLNMIGVG